MSTQERLLREALGDVPAVLLGSEPLGSGGVTAFRVGTGADAAVHYLDTSRLPVPAETGLATGEDPAHPDARIWVHPADPHLPALAPVAFDGTAAVLLARLGLDVTGPGELVAYRPGRRAVLRAPTAAGDAWVKIVRPSRVARVVEAHALSRASGLPVPTVRGWSPDGLVVLESATGAPAVQFQGDPEELLDAVDELRASIGGIRTPQRTKDLADRVPWYEGHAARIGASDLIVAIRESLASHGDPGRAVVHGDLHLGQIFLSEKSITGLIDLDTLGDGVAAEDPAAFVSHAIASAAMSPEPARGGLRALADAALRRWEHDPFVRPYTAIHLLGHAIAATDEAERERATALLAAAARVLARQEDA